MPSSYTIVFLFLLLTAFLTWIVPSSIVVVKDGVKSVIYNASFDSNGNVLQGTGTNPAGIWDIMRAPVVGFQKASGVSISILVAGAFLAVLNYVGALEAGIGRLLNRYSGNTLIAILLFIFSVCGSVYGFCEEIPAFSLMIVPLFLVAGYDIMTGLGLLFIASAIGNMASVVNPFSTGAAIGAIGNSNLSLGDGILLRIIMFIILYIVGLFGLLKYANSVIKDEKNSVIFGDKEIKLPKMGTENLPELTARRKLSLLVFGLCVVSLVVGYIPWYEIPYGDGTMQDLLMKPLVVFSHIPVIGPLSGVDNLTAFGDWYFDEFSIVFLLGTFLLAVINKIPEKDFIRELNQGLKDIISVVVVLSIANGISVLMGSKVEGISVTFVYWIQEMLQGIPAWAFTISSIGSYIGTGFFLQSTSGVSGITMPILGSVTAGLFESSSIGTIGGQNLLISTFTSGLNFTNAIYPGAVVLGALVIYNVPYQKYLKFSLKILVPMLIASTVILIIAPYIGLV